MVGQQESQAGHEVVEDDVEDPPPLEPLPLVEPAGGDDVLLPEPQQLGHEV